MTSGHERSRLRLYRDGRFLEDEPAGAAQAPLLAPDSLASRLLGYGCLAVVVLPALLVALFAGLFAVASGLGEEGTGVVLGGFVATSALSFAALVLWLGLRGRRRRSG